MILTLFIVILVIIIIGVWLLASCKPFEPRCPKCNASLDELIDEVAGTKIVKYKCPKCDYTTKWKPSDNMEFRRIK